jgi:hypothetical protein
MSIRYKYHGSVRGYSSFRKVPKIIKLDWALININGKSRKEDSN